MPQDVPRAPRQHLLAPRRLTVLLLVAAAAGLWLGFQPSAPANPPTTLPLQWLAGQVPEAAADPLDGGTDWLNTAKPLTMGDLRGRVVILDFWTLC